MIDLKSTDRIIEDDSALTLQSTWVEVKAGDGSGVGKVIKKTVISVRSNKRKGVIEGANSAYSDASTFVTAND